MATYPPISAGQRITADLLTAMLPNVIVKPTTTARASTTTFADDPDLQAPVEANAQYYIEFRILAAGVAAADIKTEWGVPSGASGLKTVLGPATGSTTNNNADNITMRAGAHQHGTDVVYNCVRDDSTLAFGIVEWGFVTTGSTSGTVAFRWAQNSSNTIATQVFGGSTMIVRRVA